MAVAASIFGVTHDGRTVTAWQLSNSSGAAVTLLDYGATVQSIRVPGRDGALTDVVLGFDTVAGYEADTCYLGATVGRVANRIGGAAIDLNGVRYPLAKNCGENHLHGGVVGFNRHVWQGARAGESAVSFTRLSPDGEEGYPGNLRVAVTFTLTEDHALCIDYDADTDRDTVVSLTNHSYFNLAGGGDAMGHTLQLFSDAITENSAQSLPTGQYLPVEGTPFDFRQPKRVGRDIGADHVQLRYGGGYDHNFVLSGPTAAVLCCEETGIRLTVETTLPGVQLYTANFLTETVGKGGRPMGSRGAVCLETQLFPDALAHDGFPSPILRGGEHLHTRTVFRFDTAD